ncbi:unnamed protein product [Adineta steineri]|uniref:Uncharacterized protein n=1 Tax=Adineta steineri TaxID=433720 RepID=A0A814CPD2_9BILA|nr:unnamed protein product [Adineta steineri]CAF3656924.1 unnamed protein product [Adineta steineri]
MESVIVVLTNAKRHAANTDLKVLQLRGNVYPFYMQNSAFSKDPKTWDHEQRESLQKDWDDSMYEVKRLLETVDKFTIQSVTAFNNMIDIRNQIKAMLHDARLRISEIQKMQDEIAAYEEAVKKYGDDQVKFKDFTKTVQNKPQLVDAPYHSTLCESCNFVCHDHCGLNETVTKGDQIFIGCWAMGGMNKCQQCPQKCSYTEHYHAKKTMKMASGTTVEIIQDIKAQYDSATSNINNAKTKIKTGADAKKVLEQALKHLTDSIIKKCRDLKSICGNFNLAAELLNFIDKLEKEALTLHSIDAKQQADSFIRGLKALCEQIKDERDRNAPPPIQMNLIDSYTTRATSAASVLKPLNDETAPVPTSKYCVSGLADDVRALLGGVTVPSTTTGLLPPNSSVISNLGHDKKKTNKKKPKKKKNDVSTESDSSEKSTSRSSSSEDDKINTKSTKKKQSKSEDITIKIDSDQLLVRDTNDLVDGYEETNDRKQRRAIVDELRNRCRGQSIRSPKDAVVLGKYFMKYSSLNPETIAQHHTELQEKIDSVTDVDILKITQINPRMLDEIFVLHQLITNNPKNENQSLEQHKNIQSKERAQEFNKKKSKNNPAAASLMQVQQPMLRQYFPFGSSTLNATSGISDDSDLSTLESTHEDNLATSETTTENEAIFIANLPSTTTKTQLFKVFSQAGRIKSNQARQQVVPSTSSWPVTDGNESPPPPSYSQMNRGGDQFHKISSSSASLRKVQHCYGRPLMINPLTSLPTSGQQDNAYEIFDDDD